MPFVIRLSPVLDYSESRDGINGIFQHGTHEDGIFHHGTCTGLGGFLSSPANERELFMAQAATAVWIKNQAHMFFTILRAPHIAKTINIRRVVPYKRKAVDGITASSATTEGKRAQPMLVCVQDQRFT